MIGGYIDFELVFYKCINNDILCITVQTILYFTVFYMHLLSTWIQSLICLVKPQLITICLRVVKCRSNLNNSATKCHLSEPLFLLRTNQNFEQKKYIIEKKATKEKRFHSEKNVERIYCILFYLNIFCCLL